MEAAPVEVKIKLIGSIFSEKIELDGKNYRTNGYNKVLCLIYQQTNKLQGYKKKKLGTSCEVSNSVPGAGLEPAQPQWSKDFKSFVSTIPPSGQTCISLCDRKDSVLFRDSKIFEPFLVSCVGCKNEQEAISCC